MIRWYLAYVVGLGVESVYELPALASAETSIEETAEEFELAVAARDALVWLEAA
jgi:hypothetical protein